MAEHNFGFSAVDSTAWAGGEVRAAHRHLIAETKGIGGVGTGGENVATGFAVHEILHGVVTGAERTERGMIPG